MGREARAGNHKGYTERAEDSEGGAGALPEVQVVEPGETITDRHYRSFCMPCEPLEDSGSPTEQ